LNEVDEENLILGSKDGDVGNEWPCEFVNSCLIYGESHKNAPSENLSIFKYEIKEDGKEKRIEQKLDLENEDT
jgi:hypothetical protein